MRTTFTPIALQRRPESLFAADRRAAVARHASEAQARASLWGDRRVGPEARRPHSGAKSERDAGGAIVGGVIGAGLGLLAGGPVGMIAGGIAGAAIGNAATSSSPTFKVGAFSATTSGALTFTNKGTWIRVASPAYNASGSVTIDGVTDAEAANWQAGFMQTVYVSSRKGHYVDSAGKDYKTYEDYCDPCPVRDGDAGVVPWYGAETISNFTTKGSAATPSMYDRPSTSFDYATADTKGTLKTTSGSDVFCSWLMVRHKTSGEVKYLKYAGWEVSYSGTVDAAAKTGTSVGGSKVTGTGDGKGAKGPLTGDPVANDAAKSRWI